MFVLGTARHALPAVDFGRSSPFPAWHVECTLVGAPRPNTASAPLENPMLRRIGATVLDLTHHAAAAKELSVGVYSAALFLLRGRTDDTFARR